MYFKPRETRNCMCGCGKTKNVIHTSSWKYFLGHSLIKYNKSDIGREHVRQSRINSKMPLVKRLCKCGCGGCKNVRETSDWEYFRIHRRRGKSYVEIYGAKKAKELIKRRSQESSSRFANMSDKERSVYFKSVLPNHKNDLTILKEN